MNVDKNLEKEVLTRLLHAHPSGLGKEVLDNYRGEKVVASALAALQGEAPCEHATPAMRQTKPVLARVWMQRQMPLIDSLCDRIASGNDSLMSLPDELI